MQTVYNASQSRVKFIDYQDSHSVKGSVAFRRLALQEVLGNKLSKLVYAGYMGKRMPLGDMRWKQLQEYHDCQAWSLEYYPPRYKGGINATNSFSELESCCQSLDALTLNIWSSDCIPTPLFSQMPRWIIPLDTFAGCSKSIPRLSGPTSVLSAKP